MLNPSTFESILTTAIFYSSAISHVKEIHLLKLLEADKEQTEAKKNRRLMITENEKLLFT